MIYFIQAGSDGPIKIGYSKDPRKRLYALRNASFLPLEIICVIDGSRDKEKSLHESFRASHIKGEWFSPSLTIYDFIKNQDQIPISSKRRPRKRKRIESHHCNGGWKACVICRERYLDLKQKQIIEESKKSQLYTSRFYSYADWQRARDKWRARASRGTHDKVVFTVFAQADGSYDVIHSSIDEGRSFAVDNSLRSRLTKLVEFPSKTNKNRPSNGFGGVYAGSRS